MGGRLRLTAGAGSGMGGIAHRPGPVGMVGNSQSLTFLGTAGTGVHPAAGGCTAGNYRYLALTPAVGSRFRCGANTAYPAVGAVAAIGSASKAMAGCGDNLSHICAAAAAGLRRSTGFGAGRCNCFRNPGMAMLRGLRFRVLGLDFFRANRQRKQQYQTQK